MKYKCPACGRVYNAMYEQGTGVIVTCYCGANCVPFDGVMTDAEVVSRFNELVKEGKVMKEVHTDEWLYRLCPSPRYRPFTAVEAAGQLGMRVQHKKVRIEEGERWCLLATDDGNPLFRSLFDCKAITMKEALENFTFFDTGEPFGVKESE